MTWDAKEQIRFLHQEQPDEWTVDRLTESFPVSRDGVVKILRSAFRPRSLNDIARHDRSVQKNWLALNEGIASNQQGGPLLRECRQLLRDRAGQLGLQLSSSASNPRLPMPDVSRLLLGTQSPNIMARGRPGVFESIVKDYCERQRSLATKSRGVSPGIKQKQDTQLLLEHIDANRKLAGKLFNLSASEPSSGHRHPGFDKSSSEVSTPSGSTGSGTVIDEVSLLVSPRHDVNGGEAHGVAMNRPLWRLRHRGSLITVDPNIVSDYATKDTRKIRTNIDKEQLKQMADENAELGKQTAVGNKYRHLAKESFPDVQNDVDPYIYDDARGYQHPFGSQRDLPENKIEIRKKDRLPIAIYRKGNDVFDENGEFLYRVP